MPETIEAKELQLKDVFDDAYRFEIPEYQRPYAWTTDEVNDLLDDLLFAMKATANVNELPPYFLGSIVIIKSSSTSPTAHLVDGQQRITTLTILFCVLRELSTSNENKNALGKYVREDSDPFADTQGQFRLNVRSRDQEFFQGNIQEKNCLSGYLKSEQTNLPDSQERMYENAKYLWNKISDLDEQQRNKLTSFLVRRCYLVIVSTSNQSSAYRIFSVMNDRGLDLSPTDILKSAIIGAMDDRIRSQYTEKWEDIEEEIGRDSFRELFGHIRMIYMKDKARGSLNDEFRDGVLTKLDSRNFVDDVLETYADAYKAVSMAEYDGPKSNEINPLLKHLSRLDNSDWIAPAMAFFDLNKENGALLFKFSRDLERLAYGMFITRANVTERISRFARVLHAIERRDDLFCDDSSLQLSSKEMTDIIAKLDGEVYRMPRVPKPLLLRLDGLLADAGATYEPSIITVEHVLPQSPKQTSKWCNRFPTSEDRDYWTHRIANLVLLSRRKNSSAGNLEFEQKKRKYFQGKGVTPFALTSQVLNEEKWTPQVLERRQKDLIRVLKKEWCLA